MDTPPPTPHSSGPSGDLLMKASMIAEFLFGDPNQRRKVYHLAETSRLPVFRLGTVLCARRSVLMDWIKAQEKKNNKNDDENSDDEE